MTIQYSVHPTFVCPLARLGSELTRTLIGRRVTGSYWEGVTAWMLLQILYYIKTRSSGRSASLLLAPAEGWGLLILILLILITLITIITLRIYLGKALEWVQFYSKQNDPFDIETRHNPSVKLFTISGRMQIYLLLSVVK